MTSTNDDGEDRLPLPSELVDRTESNGSAIPIILIVVALIIVFVIFL
jgi:hypothetical protein